MCKMMSSLPVPHDKDLLTRCFMRRVCIYMASAFGEKEDIANGM